MNVARHRAIRMLGVLAVALLSACGGGGGGGTTPLPAGSSNWDQMVWDQDNWN